ncbi:hypothetical protein SCO02_04420 [Staphylococcus ureilyticus]|uniref:Uncharacterized protein n=1 Tax=Staphylococcus ureilyticus TaxID=94138 RepID=A0AB34AF64_STAUR|nr:hypothetical protein SCO02_04420 [Staphylococcus ureilyticus]
MVIFYESYKYYKTVVFSMNDIKMGVRIGKCLHNIKLMLLYTHGDKQTTPRFFEYITHKPSHNEMAFYSY